MARKVFRRLLMEKLIKENEDMLNAENRIVDQELKARTTETEEINAHL